MTTQFEFGDKLLKVLNAANVKYLVPNGHGVIALFGGDRSVLFVGPASDLRTMLVQYASGTGKPKAEGAQYFSFVTSMKDNHMADSRHVLTAYYAEHGRLPPVNASDSG